MYGMRNPNTAALEGYAQTRAKVLLAFKDLRKEGIIARANHMCCMTCASYDLGERLEKDTKKIGAAYWHRQDEWPHDELTKLGCRKDENDGTLMIRYFGSKDTDDDAREIGDKIVAALTKHGVKVKWDRDPNVTIQVVFWEK